MHAVIGDEIRIPTLWCEFGRCIERYTREEATGERDLRGRAFASGWRYDAVGRLACPACAAGDPGFLASESPDPTGIPPTPGAERGGGGEARNRSAECR